MIVFRPFGHFGAQSTVRRNSARKNDSTHTVRHGSFDGWIDEHVDDRFLKACCNVLFRRFALPPITAIEIMPYGGFDPAKAKIVGIFFEPGARKPNRLGVALFGEVIDDSSAGIRSEERRVG